MIDLSTPLGDVTSYGYDVNNRLKTMTQPNGTTLTYDYDTLDRLVSKIPQDKPEHQNITIPQDWIR